MTNKQAQITINAIKFMLDNAQYSDDVEEALNMAISALTEQPEERTEKRTETHACDLIDRQAAIDALYDWSEHSMTDAEAWHIRQVIGDIKSMPSAQPERPKGEWITDDLSGMIYCSRCGNAAPMETTGGRQYKSKFCQTCGADMRGGMADDAQYFVDVEEALNMATNVLTAQPETHDKRTETHTRDCISRQATIDAYGDWYVEEGTADGFIGTVKQLLEGLPSAQPEIIQCKDCKHSIDFYADGECYCRIQIGNSIGAERKEE